MMTTMHKEMAEKMADLRERIAATDPHPVPAALMVEMIDILMMDHPEPERHVPPPAPVATPPKPAAPADAKKGPRS